MVTWSYQIHSSKKFVLYFFAKNYLIYILCIPVSFSWQIVHLSYTWLNLSFTPCRVTYSPTVFIDSSGWQNTCKHNKFKTVPFLRLWCDCETVALHRITLNINTNLRKNVSKIYWTLFDLSPVFVFSDALLCVYAEF